MLNLTCHCNVKNNEIENVKNHIREWIPFVEKNWDEPKYYEAFQDKEIPNSIIFFMTFLDDYAESRQSKLSEPQEFGKKLYSMCNSDPVWQPYDLVNSLRNSQTDSQIHTRVEYKVKQEAVEDVKKAIVKYIDIVRDTEPDIRVYESYQDKKDPSKFTHLAEFKDKNAEATHREISHTKKFIEFLYPLCVSKPNFIYMDMIGTVRR